ncbi:unnamed protein product [Rotaria socialis]
MAELLAQLDFHDNRNQPLALKRLRRQYEKVKNETNEYLEVDNDQEQAYLACCKALEYLNLLTKCEEYAQQSQAFQAKYQRRYTDCEEIECVLRLQLEQRYKESELVVSNNQESTDERVNDESEESKQDTPVLTVRSPTPLRVTEYEAAPSRALTPLPNQTMLLKMRRRRVPNRLMVKPIVVLDKLLVIDKQEKEPVTTYKTFDECLAATRPFSSMRNRGELPISGQLSARPQTPAILQIPWKERRTRECAVCLDEKPIADFGERFSATCNHDRRQMCTDCVRRTTHSIIRDSVTTDVHCPELNCNALFDFDTVQRLLVDFNPFSDRPKTAVKAFGHRLAMGYVENMKNFVWCAHGCGWGCELVDGAGPMFTCLNCKEKTCAHHRIKWHSGMTCAKYDRELIKDREFQQNKNWLRDHAKECPACHIFIQKNDGCDHMTCSRCKHEFCWLCFADFKPIRDHGNHNHVRHCAHYR